MNEQSLEYGIRIRGTTYTQIHKAFPDRLVASKIGGVCVYMNDNRPVESHPFNPDYIFISFGTIDGDDIPDPSREAYEIMRELWDNLPQKSMMSWGLIRTER